MTPRTSDGPQAATRNAKDRRPAYRFNAARALAHVEQRLTTLEGKKSSHQQEPSSPKCAAAIDLESDLNKFGESYNELEERLHEVENKINDSGHVAKRLETLEQRLQPYEEYQKQAQQAVQQLKRFQERFMPGVAKGSDANQKLINEHGATLREHHSRLLQLQDRAELARASALSTRDLARALMQRLKRGDTLDLGTTDDLRLWLGDTTATTSPTKTGARSASISKMFGTPATDDSTECRLANVEESIEGPKKRRKTMTVAKPQHKSSVQHIRAKSASERYSTPDVANALAVFRDAGLKSTESARVGYEDDDVGSPPERRSSRKSQAPKRNENLIHWKEANVRMRNARRGR